MIFWAHLTGAEIQRTGIARRATPEDRRHGAHYRTTGARETSVAARATLRVLLQQVTGRQDWMIVPGYRGKPELRTPDGRRGPLVSISHSHGEIAVALAAHDSHMYGMGIDLEIIRPRKAFTQIAARAFGPEECRYIETHGLTAFYRIWTLREAVSKVSGAGLLMAADGADKIRPGAEMTALAPGWQLESIESGNAMLAIAARGMVPKGLNLLQRIGKFRDFR